MVIPNKFSTLLAIALAGLLLMFAPLVGAAINTGLPSYDKLMQTELDSLMDQVAGQFENTGGYLEKSEFYSVLTQGLNGQGNIQTAFDIAQEAQNKADADPNNPELQELARIAMDDLFLAVLYQIELNKALATTDQEITTQLIYILEGRGEGFTETPGFILDPLSGREGVGPLPEEDDPVDDPEKEGFLFYGKAYDLETDIDPSRSTNGILYFTDDKFKVSATIPEEGFPTDIQINYPPAAMPLFMHQLPYIQGGLFGILEGLEESGQLVSDFIFTVDGVIVPFNGYDDVKGFTDAIREGTPGTKLAIEYVPQEIFKAPEVTKNDAFYRYTWDTLAQEEDDDSDYDSDYDGFYDEPTFVQAARETGPETIPPFSTTLYNGSNIISHVYSANQITGAPPHILFTGLTPGDGAEGHPGAALPRGLVARLELMMDDDSDSDSSYDGGYGVLGFPFGKPLNLSEETGSPFFNLDDDFCDYLIQLGGDAPSNLEEFVTIIDEEGWNLLLKQEGDLPGQGEAYLTIGEVFISLGYMERDAIKALDIETKEMRLRLDEISPVFDLSEQFVVFIPDSTEGFSEPDEGIGNQYTVHTGTPLMVVDRSRHNYVENYDDGFSSLDQAIMHISNNPDTLNNDFRPGYYYDAWSPEADGWVGLENWANGRIDNYVNSYPEENYDAQGSYMYGLQTVGAEYRYSWRGQIMTPMNTQEKLDQSNFLAYVVQVEEDIVNEKILAMHDPAIGIINGLRDYTNIRNRDAWFEQSADAKAGRVMKDIHGNWVRVQQYVLRQDDPVTTTVKVLNVSLREAGNDLSGMSTIDFTTVFDTAEQQIYSIQHLPWGHYLTTQYNDGDVKFIEYPSYGSPVNTMSVKFTNPGGESLSESRNFDGGYGTSGWARQYVSSETLTLQNLTTTENYYNYFNDGVRYEYIAWFSGSFAGGGYYKSEDAEYTVGEDDLIIKVGIHTVDDTPDESIIGTGAAGDSTEYQKAWAPLDMWAVLGAGNGAGTLSVDSGNSIEIVMDQDKVFFDKPIDTIFIPMSHMMWNNSNDPV